MAPRQSFKECACKVARPPAFSLEGRRGLIGSMMGSAQLCDGLNKPFDEVLLLVNKYELTKAHFLSLAGVD